MTLIVYSAVHIILKYFLNKGILSQNDCYCYYREDESLIYLKMFFMLMSG